MGQFQSELGGGTDTGQEDVFEVDEGRPEGAVVEGGDEGAREDVGRATEEGGEDVERVEGGGKVPLAGGVSDGNTVHHVPDQGVVYVGGDHLVVVVRNVDHH